MNDSSQDKGSNWYYVISGETFGPAGHSELADQVAMGRLTPQSLVWRQGMEHWVSAQMTGLAGLFSPQQAGGSESQAGPPPVDDTRIRHIEPKLAAFKDPASPLAQAIAAGTHPVPPEESGPSGPPPPPVQAGTRPSGKGKAILVALGVLALVLIGTGVALWMLEFDFSQLPLP